MKKNILLFLGLFCSASIFGSWEDIAFDMHKNETTNEIDVKIVGIPPHGAEPLLGPATHRFSLKTYGLEDKISCCIYPNIRFKPYTVGINYNKKTKELVVYRYPFRVLNKKVGSMQLGDNVPQMKDYSFFVSKKDSDNYRNVTISIPLK